MQSTATAHGQSSDKWKGELMATGELNTLLNKWMSRATLDIIGEGQSCTRFTIVYYSSQWFLAAFNYDYNALDGGERSAIAKGYEDIL